MSRLQARLQDDLNAARKAQDKPRTLLLSTTLAELKNRKIELIRDLNDEDVVEVLRKSIKRRRESVELYRNATRADLADKELSEIAMLEPYLPAQLSHDEIRAEVLAAINSGAANIGTIMGAVIPKLKGRADGATINAIVREELARKG